ncbi:unnamed protein product [Chrysoparadoxa australica]
MRKNVYVLTAQYYDGLHKWISIPTVLLGALSGFLSFLASADGVIPADKIRYVTLAVGAVATAGSFLGTISTALKWGTKADAFRSAAQEYRMLIAKVEVKLKKGETLDKRAWDDVGERVLDIQKGMNFFPPSEKLQRWREQGLVQRAEAGKTQLPLFLKPYKELLCAQGIDSPRDLIYADEAMLAGLGLPPITLKKMMEVRALEEWRRGFPSAVLMSPKSGGAGARKILPRFMGGGTQHNKVSSEQILSQGAMALQVAAEAQEAVRGVPTRPSSPLTADYLEAQAQALGTGSNSVMDYDNINA